MKTVRKIITLSADLHEAVIAYQEKQGLPSESATLAHLAQLGLKAEGVTVPEETLPTWGGRRAKGMSEQERKALARSVARQRLSMVEQSNRYEWRFDGKPIGMMVNGGFSPVAGLTSLRIQAAVKSFRTPKEITVWLLDLIAEFGVEIVTNP